jgi:hypothetical protein
VIAYSKVVDRPIYAYTAEAVDRAIRHYLEAYARYASDFTDQLTAFFTLRGEMRAIVRWLEGDRRHAALQRLAGQSGAAWSRIRAVLAEHGVPETASPFAVFYRTLRAMEAALDQYLTTGDLAPLTELLDEPDFQYQELYQGIDLIRTRGVQLGQAWDWLIDQGERLRREFRSAHNGQWPEWKTYTVPKLIALAESDLSAPAEVLETLRYALYDDDKLDRFRDNYKKRRAERLAKGGGRINSSPPHKAKTGGQ